MSYSQPQTTSFSRVGFCIRAFVNLGIFNDAKKRLLPKRDVCVRFPGGFIGIMRPPSSKGNRSETLMINPWRSSFSFFLKREGYGHFLLNRNIE